MSEEKNCCGLSCARVCGHGHGIKKIGLLLLGFSLIIYVAGLAVGTWKKNAYIGEGVPTARTITISGQGKITATPNIAVVSAGLITENTDVGKAQNENTKKMNALIVAFKDIGVAEADLQTTQYQIYPKYSYDQKSGSQIIGYTVTQNVDVKIRDLTKIAAVLAKAGAAGANQVSGLQFTVDEPSNLRAAARAKAVADAQDKAKKLADELRVHLGRVITFTEYSPSAVVVPMYMRDGLGGGTVESAAPSVQTGSLDITSEATLVYEIR